MARRKVEEPAGDLAGTVEGLAAEHFEREKTAYEERTGKEVKYVPGVPVTRTPIAAEDESTAAAEQVDQADIPAEGEV